MKKISLVIMLAVVLFASLSFAGRNKRVLNIFPHVHLTKVVEVPNVLSNPDDPLDLTQCTVDVSAGVKAEVTDCSIELSDSCRLQQDEGVPRVEWGIHCDDPLDFQDVIIPECGTELVIDPSKFIITCPEGVIATETTEVPFEYESLVTEAKIGDTIHVRVTVFSAIPRALVGRWVVQKVFPNRVVRTLSRGAPTLYTLDQGDNSIEEFEYQFDTPGIIRFVFVRLDAGQVRRVFSKVVVTE